MEKYIQAIFDLKKLPSQVCLVIAASGAFLFYAPENILLIKLNPKSEIYVYLYIAFVVSVFIVILSFLLFSLKSLKTLWSYISKVKEITKEISMLDDEEKAILSEFYVQQKTILDLPTSDEAVRSLRLKRIIVSASNVYGAAWHPYKINVEYRKRIYPFKHLMPSPHN